MAYQSEPALPSAQTRQSTVRRERATNGRQVASQRAPNDSAPWTASRCLRILRRLESRLALLRKLVNTSTDGQRTHATTTESGAKRPSLNSDDDERDHQRKRSRRTYGGRNKKRKTSTQPPTHASSTHHIRPLRAMKSRFCSIRTDEETFLKSKSDLHAGPSCLQKIPAATDGERSRIHSDVVAWLRSLLQITEASGTEPHRKSLLGMCLRKVPACLEDIEAWDRAMAQDEAPNSIHQTPDAALDIYSQLEGFGATTLGWRPLKQTLRAHGLWMLRKAIEEELFSSSEAARLVRLCMDIGYVDEAIQLISRRKPAFPLPRSAGSLLEEEPSLQPLHSLLTAARANKDMPLEPVFDLVSRLIKEKQLPDAWLPTRELSHLLGAATEAIGKNQGSTGAFSLVTEATAALCTVREENGSWHNSRTRLQMLNTITAALVATTEPGTCKHDMGAEARASFAMDCCINAVRTYKGLRDGKELFLLSLARFLIEDENACFTEKQRHDKATLAIGAVDVQAQGVCSQLPHHYCQAIDLVCFVAQSCSQRTLGPAHESFSVMCQKMERLPWPRWMLNGLRRDGAFVLAQKTNDLRDLAFAESQAAELDSPPSKPAKTIFSDWYWEETIGEFVVRSPKKQEGDMQNTPQPRLRSQAVACSQWSPRPPHCDQAINEEAADRVEDADNGLDLRVTENVIAENNIRQVSGVATSTRTSTRPSMSSVETRKQGALQGTTRRLRQRQWKPGQRSISAQRVGGNGQSGLKLGFASDDTSPAPIGGARQLFIVRGPGRRSDGEDHDWLDWHQRVEMPAGRTVSGERHGPR